MKDNGSKPLLFDGVVYSPTKEILLPGTKKGTNTSKFYREQAKMFENMHEMPVSATALEGGL